MDPDFGEIVSQTCSFFSSLLVLTSFIDYYPSFQLRRRSNGDLKDKYRNIQLSVAKSGDRMARREKGETLWTEEEKQAYDTLHSLSSCTPFLKQFLCLLTGSFWGMRNTACATTSGGKSKWTRNTDPL